jgi:hypothetical protein
MAHAVELLLCKCETLSSNSNLIKKISKKDLYFSTVVTSEKELDYRDQRTSFTKYTFYMEFFYHVNILFIQVDVNNVTVFF